MHRIANFIAVVIAALLVAACDTASHSSRNRHFQSGESVVLVRQEPGHVAFAPSGRAPVSVRSTYLDNLTNTVHYVEGRDYLFDSAQGCMRRTADSRIPDYSTNVLCGKNDFNHGNFPGYGNGSYFVFIDYDAKASPKWPELPVQTNFLSRTVEKLRNGRKVRLVAFGDSITAGGEATQPSLIYWRRWADELTEKYPRAEIEAVNGATGGDTTVNGLSRLEEKVLKRDPDIVLIAFGMNDHNVAGLGVPVETFAQNLRVIVDRIREGTRAEIVLVSTFPPNPKWHFGSHQMERYAAATEAVAREKQCAYADVYQCWQFIATAKKPEDLLANNINHPNDFGHAIYLEALRGLGL